MKSVAYIRYIIVVSIASFILIVISQPLYAQFGDNLGKHKADRALDMNSKNLTNVALLKYKTLEVTDKASGDIGTAATTVDLYTVFEVDQTTAAQALTLPAPTTPFAGQVAYVKNTGTASFTMYGSTVAAGAIIGLSYNGTAWTSATALGGDISGTLAASTVNKLKNASLTFTGLANNNLLQYNGTDWVNAAPSTLGTIGLLTGTSGTDVNISGSPATLGSSITLNIPDAGTGVRGLVTTGAQALEGSKSITAAADPLKLTGGVATQAAAAAYSGLVIDNATGAIRKAPVINALNDVQDNTVSNPSSLPTPNDNDSWIVAATGAGDWSGQDNKIATWDGTGWGYYTPVTNDRTSVLTGTNAGKVYAWSGTAWNQVQVASTTALSDITAAAAAHTIDNKNFAQTWNWSTLGGANALKLGSTSTAAASNAQTVLNVSLSGANATSAQTTYGAQIANTHTGTTSTNVGLSVSASGGTSNNYALIVPSGSVGIGTSTPNTSALLEVTSTTKGFLPPRIAQASLPTANATNKGMVAFCTNCTPIGLYQITTFDGGSTYAWSPLGSGTVEYINVTRMTTNVAGVGSGSDLVFDNIATGNIPYSTSTGYFTLTAGKTYRLTASPRFSSFNATGSNVVFEWVDATANTILVSGAAGIAEPLTFTGNSADQYITDIIYTPSSNQTVKLRVTNSSGTATFEAGESKAVIVQIGTTAVTNTPFSMVGTGMYDHASSGYFDIGTMRVQWGVASGTNPTTTFPASFLNTNYSIVATCSNAPANATRVNVPMVISRNTTSANWQHNYVINGGAITGASGENFNWMAIGLKP